MTYEFVKRMKPVSNHDHFIYTEAEKYYPLEYFKIEEFKIMSSEDVLMLVEKLLQEIDINYYILFQQMIQEQDCDNPVIYTFTSHNEIAQNESNTYEHEIFFYQTGTEADIYLLLHEFSHFLTNRNKSYVNDPNNRKYNEIIPILMEFIISYYLGNDNYIKVRMNELIYNSKSIMIKEEISSGNYDLDLLFKKYSLTQSDIIMLRDDLLNNKSLEYEEEIRYIYGVLYAYYYSLGNPVTNYRSLVEDYTISRDIKLPELNNNICDLKKLIIKKI